MGETDSSGGSTGRYLVVDNVKEVAAQLKTKTFGGRLRFHRNTSGLTVRDFKDIGISASRVSRWESDLLPKPDSKELLRRIAKKLADAQPNTTMEHIMAEFEASTSSESIYKRTNQVLYETLAEYMTGSAVNRELVEQILLMTVTVEDGRKEEFKDNVRSAFPVDYREPDTIARKRKK